jgi:hypothetical protein
VLVLFGFAQRAAIESTKRENEGCRSLSRRRNAASRSCQRSARGDCLLFEWTVKSRLTRSVHHRHRVDGRPTGSWERPPMKDPTVKASRLCVLQGESGQSTCTTWRLHGQVASKIVIGKDRFRDSGGMAFSTRENGKPSARTSRRERNVGTGIGAASVTVKLNGLAKQARYVRNLS